MGIEFVDTVSYFATDDIGFVKKVIIGGAYNKHGDAIGYYVVWEPETKRFKISDDGDTLFDIIPEPAVKIKKILDKYEISISGNELFLYADKDVLVEKEKSFKAALTEIAELMNKEKGKTTESQVARMFGQPESKSFAGNGDPIWSYQRNTVHNGILSYVPVVGLFANAQTDTNKVLAILFNKKGTVKNWEFTSSTNHLNAKF